jgi:hypothetical protein
VPKGTFLKVIYDTSPYPAQQVLARQIDQNPDQHYTYGDEGVQLIYGYTIFYYILEFHVFSHCQCTFWRRWSNQVGSKFNNHMHASQPSWYFTLLSMYVM